MKQKQLLIAFGALVLAACGGSIDLGPKIPAPPITEPEEPVGRQLVPYEIELTTDRDWITKPNYQDPDDVAPDVVFIEDGIEIYATSPNQQLATRVDGPLDMRDARMTFTLSVDEDYLATSPGLQPFQQVFTLDPGGDPDEDNEEGGNWGCWTGVGSWEPNEPTEVECHVPAGDMYDLAENQYALIGVQSQGDDVTGFLRLHHIDFQYWIGEPEEEDAPITGGFPLDDTGNWSVQDDGASVEFTESGVAFTPDFSGEYGAKLVWMYEGPVDLTGRSVAVEFMVEQAFIDAGATIHVHIQQNFGDYNQQQCAVDNTALTAGEIASATCEIKEAEEPDEAMAAEEGQTLRVGINVSSDTNAGTITITGFKISDDGVDMTDGWDSGAQEMEYTEDGARYFPTGDNQQFFTTVTGPLVMDGGNFVITVSADQDFIDSGAAIQPFAQGIEHGDKAVWSCWINGGDNLADGPVEAVCPPDDGTFSDFELEEGESAKFGIQVKHQPETAPVAGSVTVHSLIINPGE